MQLFKIRCNRYQLDAFVRGGGGYTHPIGALILQMYTWDACVKEKKKYLHLHFLKKEFMRPKFREKQKKKKKKVDDLIGWKY